MSKIKTALIMIAAVLVLAGCGVNSSNKGIIKTNDTVITQKEYNEAFDAVSNGVLRNMGIDAKKDPDNIMVLMAKDQVISQLVINSMLDNEIEKHHITVSKAEIDEAEKEISGRFGSKDQFEQILKLNGTSYKDFRKKLEQEIKIKKYIDSIAMVSIGEAEAEKFYNENPAKFEYPMQVRASHILISADEDAVKAELTKENKDISEEELNNKTAEKMKAAEEKAEALRKEAEKNPSSFAELAKNNSEDKMSAVKGGDLDFFTREEMVKEFSDAAFSLKPNTISGVVKSPYGYHIIMVTDRKEAGRYTFEETKNDIIAQLENQEKMKIFKDKIAELGRNANIEYLDENYNPETLRKKIKEAAKDNPELKKIMDKQEAEENKG